MLDLLDLIYPRKCKVCGEVLDSQEEHLCRHCLDEMPLTYFWSWRENPAEKILWGRTYFQSVSSLFFYESTSEYNNLIHRIKYKGDIKLAVYLGKMLGEHMCSTLGSDIDLLIPVPLHWWKKWKRGYNQAEVIADGIAQGLPSLEGLYGIPSPQGLSDLPSPSGLSGSKPSDVASVGSSPTIPSLPGSRPVLTDILKRSRFTPSQTKIQMGSKWENLQNAFTLNTEKAKDIEGKHILLVDDVLTSGATTEACYNELSKIPGIKISLATIAYVELP